MSDAEPGTMPSRALLLEDLRRLQVVSVELEQLTNRLSAGQPLSADDRMYLDRLTAEQAQLVDGFVVLAQDGAAVERYRSASRDFQADMQALRDTEDAATLSLLRDRISAGIEVWISALEQVIRDVVSRAA